MMPERGTPPNMQDEIYIYIMSTIYVVVNNIYIYIYIVNNSVVNNSVGTGKFSNLCKFTEEMWDYQFCAKGQV